MFLVFIIYIYIDSRQLKLSRCRFCLTDIRFMGERVRKVHGHPGRGGEEASTKPRAKGKTKAAGPSGGRRKREDEESRSRRIMTETYKSQSCVKDFIVTRIK